MKRFLLLLSIAIIILNLANCSSEQRLRKRVERIHADVLTVDTHCDTPLKLLRENFDLGKRNDPHKRGGRVDFIRMQEGGLDASFFAAFIAQGSRDATATDSAYAKARHLIALIRKSIRKYNDLAEFADSPDDAYEIARQGKRAIYMGLENGYPIGTDLNRIEDFYNRGVRYTTLCHTANNDICDSSTDSSEHGGLSDFGREAVQEMNRLGMLIDVSHISDASFYDVIETSAVPVIASHSCARAICDHPRNMDDSMLRALARNDGVIQLCIYSGYIKTITQDPRREAARDSLDAIYPGYSQMTDDQLTAYIAARDRIDERYPRILATVSDAVDHIDHIVELIGIEHVGIGSDFDGGGALADCFDVSQMGNITLELLRRGYRRDEIEKIWGGNFMRVFRAAQEYARQHG